MEQENSKVINNYHLGNNPKDERFWGRITYLIVGGVCGIVGACFRGFGMYKFNTHRSANFGFFDKSVIQVRESYLNEIGHDREKYPVLVDFGLDEVMGIGVSSASSSLVSTGTATSSLAFSTPLFLGLFAVQSVFSVMENDEQNKAIAEMRILLESIRDSKSNHFDQLFFEQYLMLIVKSRFFYSWLIWFLEKLFLFLSLYAFVCFVIDSDKD